MMMILGDRGVSSCWLQFASLDHCCCYHCCRSCCCCLERWCCCRSCSFFVVCCEVVVASALMMIIRFSLCKTVFDVVVVFVWCV